MTAPVIPPAPLARRLSPTDISQFIRLEQCGRYLRFQMAERTGGRNFMREYDVAPQAMTPLLTQSGRVFEGRVEAAVSQHFPTLHLAHMAASSGAHLPDNERVVAEATRLAPGERIVLFQPRLDVTVEGWELRGDVDLLRMARDADGGLHLFIADMKSSTAARMEHRLQVAFYHTMLARLLDDAGVSWASLGMGILYRGKPTPDTGDEVAHDPAAEALLTEHSAAAAALLGVTDAFLEIVDPPDSYIEAVQDLVTGPGSRADYVARARFEDIPYTLGYKCDGCLFNEFCMKWTAEHDDLSLLPYLTGQEKGALHRAGVRRIRDLATLKDLHLPEETGEAQPRLTPALGREAQARDLAATWPIGPRLDELILRARSCRSNRGDPITSISYIPGKGYSSLPYCDAQHDPNLVRVYLDAQHDYLHDRVYLLAALVVPSRDGVEDAGGRRAVVRLAHGIPDDSAAEEALFVRWIQDTVAAIVESAAPDAAGEKNAPIHLIFYNRFAQRVLLDGLARHARQVFGATPLYDFVTQIAAFDSPIVSYLDQEIRERRNFPMVCQSLQSVSAYLGFAWNEPLPYRKLFNTRLFDSQGKLELNDGPVEGVWYTRRARYNSQIPLEYAYGAWGELESPTPGRADDLAPYRATTTDSLVGFEERRLDAMEYIAHHFKGNRLSAKGAFALPDLPQFHGKARSLAHALEEFVTIERHVELAEWKAPRYLRPERRLLLGETLLARYVEADQDPATAARVRENARRVALAAEYKAASPDGKLTPEQYKETNVDQDGLVVRLRLVADGADCDLDAALAMTNIKPDEMLILYPRLVAATFADGSRGEMTPTMRQLLRGMRVTLARLNVQRDEQGRATAATAELALQNDRPNRSMIPYAFDSYAQALLDGSLCTLDTDMNSISAYWDSKVLQALAACEDAGRPTPSVLYERLKGLDTAALDWPAEAAAGQARFLAGLETMGQARRMFTFEESKRDYIGGCGDAPILLVQGPPGTGKSYSTAFALLARLQGAMAAGRPYRVVVSCKTHAALDVLLEKIALAQRELAAWQAQAPDLFTQSFDPRLLDAPIYRVEPRDTSPQGIITLSKGKENPNRAKFAAQPWAILGATPGGIYKMANAGKNVFGRACAQCLVLDEASQINLPEALRASLLLEAGGQLIVVGDHRQMPPIVKHDWDGEPRRTFQEYRAYESLFLALLRLNPRMIKFERSFRLHHDMAEFLRQEIYRHDGIPYYSTRHDLLEPRPVDDAFVRAVLAPEHPLVVVVHDEAESQTRNAFEQALVTPIVLALADGEGYGLDPQHGMGIVVPHRAQRAALQEALPALSVFDDNGNLRLSAVDTVERFQGGEREVILVSATESQPEYILAAGTFLLDPRRLTVAISRAKRKMILVASRSVFTLFNPDEEVFANAQLWKDLLRRTCTQKLWAGERAGRYVEVWGNPAGEHRE
ncbi:MAG: AAA domain-containing protein [Anaerolineae bacterium]